MAFCRKEQDGKPVRADAQGKPVRVGWKPVDAKGKPAQVDAKASLCKLK
jgi:hypothetical protein